MAVRIALGERYGRLTVIGPSVPGKDKHRRMLVRCDCGAVTEVKVSVAAKGRVQSCGCLRNERGARQLAQARPPARGPAGTEALQGIWRGMWARCTDPKNKSWKNYGGRGIAVAVEWRDFLTFYVDMGQPPDGLVLDRTNNDKGYSKDNCAWVTRLASAQNRRNTIWIEHDNCRLTLTQLSAKIGVPYGALHARYTSMRGNIDIQKLAQPLRK